jgi:hypothetical protein
MVEVFEHGQPQPRMVAMFPEERPIEVQDEHIVRVKLSGPASCLSNSASKVLAASGDGVFIREPKMETPAPGEGMEGLPGFESVARAEGGARNRGGPGSPCRTNCEGQAGTEPQRQEATPDAPGVGLAHSIPPQGISPEAGEGANKSTQSAQATSAVRTTERDWPTFLRAIP